MSHCPATYFTLFFSFLTVDAQTFLSIKVIRNLVKLALKRLLGLKPLDHDGASLSTEACWFECFSL